MIEVLCKYLKIITKHKYTLITSPNIYSKILVLNVSIWTNNIFDDNEFALVSFDKQNTIKFNSLEELSVYIDRLEKLKVMI